MEETDFDWSAARAEAYNTLLKVLKRIADKEDATEADAQIFAAAASAVSNSFIL